jgi:hypothetical protein
MLWCKWNQVKSWGSCVNMVCPILHLFQFIRLILKIHFLDCKAHLPMMTINSYIVCFDSNCIYMVFHQKHSSVGCVFMLFYFCCSLRSLYITFVHSHQVQNNLLDFIFWGKVVRFVIAWDWQCWLRSCKNISLWCYQECRDVFNCILGGSLSEMGRWRTVT